MNVLVVVAHPEPTSFCASLAQCAVETLSASGHRVTVSDLYADRFDPVGGPNDFVKRAHSDRFGYQREQVAAVGAGTFEPTLAAEIARVREADAILLHFPLWWFGFPAILKGWVDRVFAMGVAYGPGLSHATGPLRGRRAMLTITTGSPESTFTTTGANGDLQALLFPIHYGILHFAGIDVIPPFVAYGAARCSDDQRQQYLSDYTTALRGLEATTPLVLGPTRLSYVT